MSTIPDAELKTIITDENGTELVVRWADRLGNDLKRQGLATSQIQALFGEVRQIQAQWSMDESKRQKALRRLILLKPKMAYRSRKERGKAVQELVNILSPALDQVIEEKDSARQEGNFQRFVEFFEAILAYHKAHGGN